MIDRQLEKILIQNLDAAGEEPFPVQFNPSEYSLEDASKWSDQERMGQVPELQFTGGERKKLTMELFFDTYESRTDVREHTYKIAKLLEFNSEADRPPRVKIIWGPDAPGGGHAEFPFVCVLESLKQQYILFLEDGTPVRAKLNVSFLQFSLPEEELKKNEPHSPDHSKIYIVKTGDTAASIANLFYQDPNLWRPIAIENDFNNPRVLRPGQVITIPKIA